MHTTTHSYNTIFIALLGDLESIMLKRGEPFRARAYKKAQETIMLHEESITQVAQIVSLPNIGNTVIEKLNEYVNTGKILLIEEEKNNPINIFQDIYGVGPKKAEELVKVHHITSINELRARNDMANLLNDVQRIGVKYYEDILARIPRSEIVKYNDVFAQAARNVGMRHEVVGSFRRGAQDSGDIDVIVTTTGLSNDNNNSSTPFKLFVNELITNKIIVEVLSRGDSKSLVIARLPGHSCARRVDFLFAPPHEYAFAILYFTGSKMFNTNMRQHALNKGYTLNEHGISKIVRTNGLPVSKELVKQSFPDEKSIFDFLEMDYKTPQERTGDLVQLATQVAPVLAVAQVATHPIKRAKNTTQKRKMSKIGSKPDASLQDTKLTAPLQDIRLMIVHFKKRGVNALSLYSREQIKRLLDVTNDAYHNHVPLITDNEFDIIQEYALVKYGIEKTIGAPISEASISKESINEAIISKSKNEKNGVVNSDSKSEPTKTLLPYEMASMDKIKPDTSALKTWQTTFTGPYVISCKLDGVSGLYCTENGTVRLYTRGDGKTGQNISHFIPYLKLPQRMNIAIRGEFIISKKIFEESYKHEFANPRNLVAGILNTKQLRPSLIRMLADVCFVAYEVITPVLKPSEQFAFLKQLKCDTPATCVQHVMLPSANETLSNETLSKYLLEWRSNYLFETDGVIVCDDKVYPRKSGNPTHAFAFKMALSEQMAEATVVGVQWSASKDGFLKPRVQIEPVILSGVKIEYATGFNAAFIVQNKVGVGARVELIRSGDVIPHIKRVIVHASEPLLPDCEYKWNETGIDIVLVDVTSDDTVLEKNIASFFKGIEVDGLSNKGIMKLIQAGFNTVPKIIGMKKEEMSQIDGFGAKSADKICDGIKSRMASASLVTLMSSSNVFGRGFGEKKLQPILDAYPNIIFSNDSKEEKLAQVLKVKGIAQKSAEAFIASLDACKDFLQQCGKDISLANAGSSIETMPVSLEKHTHPLFQKTVVFTGFRDKELLQRVKQCGAKEGASVNKNTFVVVTKPSIDAGLSGNSSSEKLKSAAALGIPILNVDEFRSKYFA